MFTKFQKIAITWLVVFSVACIANSILIICFQAYESFEFAMELPFAHFGAIVVGLFIYSIYSFIRFSFQYPNKTITGAYKYDVILEKNYPDIWNKLHPFGQFSHNDFASIGFMYGKFDDGTNIELNQIKHYMRVNFSLMLWAFFLTPIIWVFSIILGIIY